ncbi:MAG TPA: sugar ABC transporter ATP-binding protein [Solirubrobacteraceae bacterium]|jgi:ABC-type sugar transport system ATPase subunit
MLGGTLAPHAVRITGLAKSFGPTRALRNCNFELRRGEVHALVGENGCGKSTLVKILSGVHAPDAGLIDVNGSQFASLRSPHFAQQNGIVTVFQEILVAGARSVLDNIWLGSETAFRAPRSSREKRRLASETIDDLLGRPLRLNAPIEELSLSDRQACCIVRALVRQASILILDEATSALDVEVRDRLFARLAGLSAAGAAVVFISHRIDEITEVGDRTTVMRSGDTIATVERGKWSPSELVKLMTGSDRLADPAADEDRKPDGPTRVLASARGLQLRSGREPFDFSIASGEIVGVAGLEGHGQTELLEALRGAGSTGGRIVVHDEAGHELIVRSRQEAAKYGIAYVARDRRAQIFGWMSIRENFGIPTLSRDGAAGLLFPNRTARRLDYFIGRLGIRLGRQGDRITTLSGGNQQKVVIARWLAARPSVLLLNDPTRGIDIGAKRDLYALLQELAREGLGIVMLSSELDEHVDLMSRVIVFREHELFREFQRAELSRGALVSAFFGEGDE